MENNQLAEYNKDVEKFGMLLQLGKELSGTGLVVVIKTQRRSLILER